MLAYYFIHCPSWLKLCFRKGSCFHPNMIFFSPVPKYFYYPCLFEQLHQNSRQPERSKFGAPANSQSYTGFCSGTWILCSYFSIMGQWSYSRQSYKGQWFLYLRPQSLQPTLFSRVWASHFWLTFHQLILGVYIYSDHIKSDSKMQIASMD